MEYNIIWKIRLPRILWQAILGEHFLFPDFYYRPSLKILLQVPLYSVFPPEPNGGSSGDDLFSGTVSGGIFLYADHSSLYRFTDRHRFYPSGVQTDQSYGNTFSSRYHDRLYLFSGHRFCGDFCRGLRHCQPARMEPGKLFRYELEHERVAAVVIGVTILIIIFHVQADRELTSWEKPMPRVWV